MSNSSTIQSKNPTVRTFFVKELLAYNLFNGESSEALKEGQEVYISGNLTVKKRTSGAQFPIGYVKVGNDAAGKMSVVVNASSDLQVIASGTLTPGRLVKPTGVISSDGVPTYVHAADGDYACGIVIQGGATTTQCVILLLHAPTLLLAIS